MRAREKIPSSADDEAKIANHLLMRAREKIPPASNS
jgi:hypothetical protein